MKKRIINFYLLTFSLLTVCCSTEQSDIATEQNGKIEVSIGQSIKLHSRTGVGDDGHTAIWTDGDQIAVWAKNSDGVFEMEGEKFSLYHFTQSYTKAVFSAFIDPLTANEYTYYATYPMPNSVSGTKATYTIPSEQNGQEFVGSCDIMVASPVTAGPLLEGKTADLGLHFMHKMHALRIVLPGDGTLMGNAVDRIELQFPCDVVGDITVDAANPTAAATLSNGSNSLSIDIPDGYSEGDYIWAMVFPTTISGDITYRLYAGQYRSVEGSINLNKQVEPSHITPMSVDIPDPYLVTTITIDITENYLGEDFNTLTILDMSGNVISTFNANSTNKYPVTLNGEIDAEQLAGSQYILRFDSDNAIVDNTITLPKITPYYDNTVTSAVPYLLFEDFSQATAYEQNDAYTPSAETQTGSSYRKGYLLDDHMSRNGWNAARFKIDQGNCIRINVRYESGGWVVGRYCGRLDTPALSALKSSANVSIKLDFDLACFVPLGYKTSISSIIGVNEVLDDTANSVTYYQIGKHTSSQSGSLNGDTQNDISNIVYSSPTFVRNIHEDTFNNLSFIPQSVTISDCGQSSRITWWPSTTRDTSYAGANCAYYIYIDNIRISIAK